MPPDCWSEKPISMTATPSGRLVMSSETLSPSHGRVHGADGTRLGVPRLPVQPLPCAKTAAGWVGPYTQVLPSVLTRMTRLRRLSYSSDHSVVCDNGALRSCQAGENPSHSYTPAGPPPLPFGRT